MTAALADGLNRLRTSAAIRDKIADMKMNAGFAAVVITAILAVAAVRIWAPGSDAGDIIQIINLLFTTYALNEIREVKANTNGISSAQQAELTMYRQHQAQLVDRGMDAMASSSTTTKADG